MNKDKDYEYWMNSNVKTAFWGTSIELIPIGLTHIKLHGHNELYTIERPSTIVHNIIMGQMFVAHEGKMVCRRKRLDNPDAEEEKMSITFHKSGWSVDERYRVEGKYETDSRKYHITGKWNDCV